MFASFGVNNLLVNADEINLLRNKSATQSSNHNGLFPAEYAVDGNLNWPKCSNTKAYAGDQNPDENPWLEVDIGAETPVNNIKLFNRDEHDGHYFGRMNGVKVQLMDRNRDLLHELDLDTTPAGAIVEFDFTTFSPQFLRVHGVDTAPDYPGPILGICEVEAYLLIPPSTQPSTSPSSKPSTSPSAKTSSTPSSLPTAFFDSQNFEIGKPQSRFNNDLGAFSVPLNYTEVGHSVVFLNVTLMEEGCDEPVIDPVITLNSNIFTKVDFATPSVAIDTTEFSASSLVVNKSQGGSIGVLKFCVRAEGYAGELEGDSVSVSFRQDDISVGYNLTSNNFIVEDNEIIADEILLSENNVTAIYGVDAFRCSTSFEEDDTVAVLRQNEIVYVCIKPANTGVFISDFNMAFWQDDAEKYTAVSLAVMEVNPLSQLSTGGNDDKTKRVASRVVSSFFEGDAAPFLVKGNAFLSFSTDSRRLRSIQDSSEVGEGNFEMEVGLEKGISSTTTTGSSITEEGTVMYVIGGILALSISMVVFKKMKA